MKLNPPTRRRGGFHPTQVGFHREIRFNPPERVDLVEKDSGLYPILSLFLVRETGLEPVRWKHTPLKRARLPIPPLPRTLVL